MPAPRSSLKDQPTEKVEVGLAVLALLSQRLLEDPVSNAAFLAAIEQAGYDPADGWKPYITGLVLVRLPNSASKPGS